MPHAYSFTLVPRPFIAFIPNPNQFSNPNDNATAANINAIAISPNATPLIDQYLLPLQGQSAASYANALNRLQPSLFSSYTEQNIELVRFLTSMFHTSSLSFCCPNQKQNIVCRYENMNVWIQPYSLYFRLDPYDDQVPEFRSTNAGSFFGFDYSLGDGWLVGCGRAYNYDRMGWSDQYGHANMNSGFLSLYTEWTNDRGFAGATILGGADRIDTHRRIQYASINQTAKSSHWAFDFATELKAGIVFRPEPASDQIICPYAKLYYLYFHQNSAEEHGAGPADLFIVPGNAQTFVSEVGLQWQNVFYFKWGCMAPLLGFNWITEVPLERHAITTDFLIEPLPFQVLGYRSGRYVFSFPVQFSATHDCMSFILGYTPKFGTHYFGQDGSFQFNFAF